MSQTYTYLKKKWRYITAAGVAVLFIRISQIYPAELLMVFFAGWIFGIPASVAIYLVYAGYGYMKDRKHRLLVRIDPSPAMISLAKREKEMEIMRHKLYEEFYKQKYQT